MCEREREREKKREREKGRAEKKQTSSALMRTSTKIVRILSTASPLPLFLKDGERFLAFHILTKWAGWRPGKCSKKEVEKNWTYYEKPDFSKSKLLIGLAEKLTI